MSKKPKGINSGFALKEFKYIKAIKLAPAAKIELIMYCLRPPIFDEFDNIVGYGKPIITKKQAIKLMNKK